MDQANNIKEVCLSEIELFPADSEELSSLSDAKFFHEVASLLAKTLRPRKVLDAGCAFGFLVEAFWDLGIESWGIDISPYAIQNTRPDVRSYCHVGDIASEIDGSYDLIACLEVLEHMPSDSAVAAVERMCRCTDTVLFSSVPYDLIDPAHSNSRPIMYWLTLFQKFGFEPDLLFDASFVASHAMLLRRRSQPWPTEVLQTFANLLRVRRLALTPSDAMARAAGPIAPRRPRTRRVMVCRRRNGQPQPYLPRLPSSIESCPKRAVN